MGSITSIQQTNASSYAINYQVVWCARPWLCVTKDLAGGTADEPKSETTTVSGGRLCQTFTLSGSGYVIYDSWNVTVAKGRYHAWFMDTNVDGELEVLNAMGFECTGDE